MPTETANSQHERSALSTALTATAAAAATGAATYVVRKALHDDSDGASTDESVEDEYDDEPEDEYENDPEDEYAQDDADEDEDGEASTDGAPRRPSLLASAWRAAAEALIPDIEQAAEGVGRYVAEHAPELLRQRIIPRFIDAFDEAS